MSWLFLVGILSASLLGSLHCVGMCGAFVAVYSTTGAPGRSAFAHLVYHSTRGALYIGLGALAGGLGQRLDQLGSAVGWVHAVAALGSVVAIGLGVSVFFPRFRSRLRLPNPFRRGLVKLGRGPKPVQAGALGLLTPLLPCGWLYAFLAVAAGTGSAANGAITMAAFWAGTVPALLGFGALVGKMSASLRRRVPAFTGVALICVGLLGVTHRFALPAFLGAHASDGTAADASSRAAPACH